MERIFASEKDREAWEISRAAEKVAESLPPEDPSSCHFNPVEFPPEVRSRGLHVIFTVGTTHWMSGVNAPMVPDRTLRVLDELKIPYDVLDEPRG